MLQRLGSGLSCRHLLPFQMQVMVTPSGIVRRMKWRQSSEVL